jgi:thioredoxin-related protein
MRKLVVLLLAAAVSFGIGAPLNAARTDATAPAHRLELLVIEVAGCRVCDLVRTYIQPAYEASPHARQVPMRYVDVTSQDELALGLNERVATVPTVVLMRDGREVDRIAGYTGPHNFLIAISSLLNTVSD